MIKLSGQIKNGKLKLDRPDIWKHEINKLEGKKVAFTITRNSGQRTINQNSALHLYCALLAEEFNAAGLTMNVVLAKATDVEWDMDSIKNKLWRPLQILLLKKKSTTELDKHEDIDKIYDHVNRFTSTFGISVEFPSQDVNS